MRRCTSLRALCASVFILSSVLILAGPASATVYSDSSDPNTYAAATSPGYWCAIGEYDELVTLGGNVLEVISSQSTFQGVFCAGGAYPEVAGDIVTESDLVQAGVGIIHRARIANLNNTSSATASGDWSVTSGYNYWESATWSAVYASNIYYGYGTSPAVHI
jgi:hypothetical protein